MEKVHIRFINTKRSRVFRHHLRIELNEYLCIELNEYLRIKLNKKTISNIATNGQA